MTFFQQIVWFKTPHLIPLLKARYATLETNTELCTRFGAGICEAMVGCAPTEQVDSALEQLGQSSVYDYCLGLAPIQGFVSSCESSGQFAPEDSLSSVPNTRRQGARMCVSEIESATSCFISSISDYAACGAALSIHLSSMTLLVD